MAASWQVQTHISGECDFLFLLLLSPNYQSAGVVAAAVAVCVSICIVDVVSAIDIVSDGCYAALRYRHSSSC